VIGAPVAAIAVLACARSGELRILADSTTAPGAVEVLALPPGAAASLAEPPARALADSLSALYRSTRASLNARADSLARTDRRTPAYAAAYSLFALARDSAERLRTARDSARRAAPPPRPVPDSLVSVSVRAPLANGAATLSLHEGPYLLAFVNSRGTLTRPPLRVSISASSHDTLRLHPIP